MRDADPVQSRAERLAAIRARWTLPRAIEFTVHFKRGTSIQDKANALELIDKGSSDIAALLAEVERLEGALRDARDLLHRYCHAATHNEMYLGPCIPMMQRIDAALDGREG